MYQQIRAMKGRGEKVAPLALHEGQVIRVDGLKYRVQAHPERSTITGSVLVPVYSEDNQMDTLFLNPRSRVPVIGELA